MLRVAAVDLGASSVRVAVIDLDERPPSIEVVHRHSHAPVSWTDGSLRWSWDAIAEAVRRGLERALQVGAIASIGVDAWGVDYGLIGEDGSLLSPPFCYRDGRTAGWMKVVERIGAERLYRITGIQLLRISTIFQLAAHDPRELSRARRLLMLPELFLHQLIGAELGEHTSAGTTALVDITTNDWSRDLLDAVAVDAAIMPRISNATALAGTWRGVQVYLVGGHDTASAVAALPAPKANTAFISSGTWMLVGAERDAPDVSDRALRANFSNEPGVFGTVRFLKNMMGLWLLEQCRDSWGRPPLHDLLVAASALPPGGPTFNPADPRLLAPAAVEAEIRSAAGLPPSAGRVVVARCILDSLAQSAAAVVRELQSLLGEEVPEIVVVGGGSQNFALNRLTETASGVPVRPGPVEATLLGNALVQGIALGRFSGIVEARAELASLDP